MFAFFWYLGVTLSQSGYAVIKKNCQYIWNWKGSELHVRT